MSKSKTDSTDSTLDEIDTVAEAFNKKADEATEYLKRIDERLQDAGAGVTCWGPRIAAMDCSRTTGEVRHALPGWRPDEGKEDKPVPARERTFLMYAKVQSRWTLAVSTDVIVWPGTDDQTEIETSDPTALLRSDRETRLLAVPHIPQLLQDLLDEMKARIEQAEPKE